MTAFFMLGVLLYLQGNWFFARYGIMDGTAIDWGKYKVHAVTNTLAWCIPIALACALAAQGKGIPKALIGYVSFGIVGVEVLSLLVIAGGKLAKGEYSSHGGYRFSSEGQFQLSSNHDNVLVVCADNFDANQIPKVFESDPGLKRAFDGFTFFPDAVGTSLYSEESAITLLTGNQFHLLNVPFPDNVREAWRNSFFDGVLKENGFSTSLFLQKDEMIPETVASRIRNARAISGDEFDILKLCATLYRMVLFKYAPHVFKKHFWYATMDFDRARRNVFSWENIDFWRHLREDGFSCVPTTGGLFHFYWIKGAHPPFTMTRSGEQVFRQTFNSVAGVTDYDMHLRLEQMVGVVRIFAHIIRELKEIGVYDRTAIVFAADHADIVRANPLLLIKPRGSRGDMRVSSAPVSMIEDWKPTFERLVHSVSSDSAKTMFDIQDAASRLRPLYVYDIDQTFDRRYRRMFVRHYGAGEMLKQSPHSIVDYVPGQNIFLVGYDGFHVQEFDPDGTPFVWTNGKQAEIPLRIQGKFHNLRLDMDISTFNGEQSFTIRANGYPVAASRACGRSSFSYIIPSSIIGEDQLLTIRIDLPDAVSPHSVVGNGDVRNLALKIYALKLSATEKMASFEYTPGTSLSFAGKDGAPALNYCLSGFSHQENGFTWTSDGEAQMRFVLPDWRESCPKASLALTLHYQTFLPEERVAISINGGLIADYVARGEETQTFQIPTDAISSNGILDLVLRLPDATSPHSLGKGRDKRLLALRCFNISIH